MSVQIQYTQVIDKPVVDVFHFYAHDHVRNHPRWDPDIELWLESDETLTVGTVIHRRNSRSGKPVEGTMQVVEYEPNRVLGMIIRDGSVETRGRTLFESLSDNQTRITTIIDLPGMDESMDKSFIMSRLERSGKNMKQLMESEI
jgi:hypothetical protein